ncbi:MAG: 5-oxoprolinase subunit PxpB [Cellvibrionaceae bacterium]|nr:5-oxoprolinase subunit PxpB [Cellvibrionaceae bacterium]
MRDLQRLNHNSLIIYFGEEIDAGLLSSISHCRDCLLAHCGDLIIDMVPAYISLLVVFDDDKVSYAQFAALLRTLLATPSSAAAASQPQQFVIPVLYAADMALDLLSLSRKKNMLPQQLIDIHSAKSYTVYTIGFSPGFAYLGEVDRAIAAPRLARPRTKVPAGSVGIADTQTGVYPLELPGGWNIIGRTPLRIFEAEQGAFPMQIGDSVRFCAIDARRYRQLLGRSLLDFQG